MLTIIKLNTYMAGLSTLKEEAHLKSGVCLLEETDPI